MTGAHGSRRDMLQGLLALSSVAALGGCGNEGSRQVLPSNVQFPIGSERYINSYTEREEQIVRLLSDILIPDTDSPGAVAAGVPDRMKRVLIEWMDPRSRRDWVDQLNVLTADLERRLSGDLLSAEHGDIVVAVADLDERAYGKGGKAASAYRTFKREVVAAYYTSEVGCTDELRWLAVPGDWKSCVPFSDIGRTWAV
ncbi:MAG: gluconate 2-dehydrogenase subunit 3 family protein [Pseudomonadota bacterium]